MTWLQDILDATVEVESPKSFIYWSALSAISAAIGKRAGLYKQIYTLYPNLYVILIAEAGGRKGWPIWMAKTLVTKVNCTKNISGRNTIESILTNLSKARSREIGPPLVNAEAFITSGEFHTLLQKNDDAFGILTDLYDTHSNELWENSSKTGGVETLKNVCVTLLVGSNEAMLRDVLPSFTLEGGFIGRLLTISDDGSGGINPLTRPFIKPFIIDDYVPYLKAISEIKGGCFEYSPKAMLLFEDWYPKLRKLDRTGDKTGALNRMHDQVLKVAMLISLSERLDLIISENNLETAITKVTEITKGLGKITAGSGKAEHGEAFRIILTAIATSPDYTISKMKLLHHYWGNFDSVILARAIDHFKEAKMIEIDLKNGETYYRLSTEHENTAKYIRATSKGEN